MAKKDKTVIKKEKLPGASKVKEKIIAAAEEVFARSGLDGATTQEIAERAGINKSLLHYHFGSKKELYFAVMDKILFDLIHLTQEVLRKNLPFVEGFEVFYRGFFDFVATHKYLSRLAVMDIGGRDSYFENIIVNFMRPLFRRAEAFIAEGIKVGVFHPVDPRHFLVSAYGMTMTYFAEFELMRLLFEQDPLSPGLLEARRESTLQMMFAALGNPDRHNRNNK
jgi:TetR/AcrR family transcriptional regulator